MKYLTNLKTENFDSIYATDASFGNLTSTTNTQANLILSSLTTANLLSTTSITSGSIKVNGDGRFDSHDIYSSVLYSSYLVSGANLCSNTCTISNVLTTSITSGTLNANTLCKKAEVYAQTGQSNVNGITLTAAMISSGFIDRSSAGAGKTDTLDTATNFVSQFSFVNTGTVVQFYYYNNSSNNITIALGTGGVSINGSTTLTAGKVYDIRLVFVGTANYFVIIN
jgi:hypothetical protein